MCHSYHIYISFILHNFTLRHARMKMTDYEEKQSAPADYSIRRQTNSHKMAIAAVKGTRRLDFDESIYILVEHDEKYTYYYEKNIPKQGGPFTSPTSHPNLRYQYQLLGMNMLLCHLQLIDEQ